MCNVELYGYCEEEARVIEAIRKTLFGLGFDGSNAVTTIMYNREVEDRLEDGIQLVGYDIDAAIESREADRLPMGVSLVDSCTESIEPNDSLSPYLAVFAHTQQGLYQMVNFLKVNKVNIDTEKHLIVPPGEYEYPCVRVLASEEGEIAKVATAMEQLGFKVYKKLIGFEPASAMR